MKTQTVDAKQIGRFTRPTDLMQDIYRGDLIVRYHRAGTTNLTRSFMPILDITAETINVA